MEEIRRLKRKKKKQKTKNNKKKNKSYIAWDIKGFYSEFS